jgi:sterol desaturase/sphingolipid hydroxylase (fatty acid hydroxylase superfamily)
MSVTHDSAVSEATPIRLFPSDTLEFFTHVHPAVVPVVWVPVAAVFLLRAVPVATAAGHSWSVVFGFASGLLLWTIAEYLLHRFIFHFTPRTPLQERVLFLMHGVHHAQPRVKTRLVMPLMVSVPLAFLFYLIFFVVVSRILGAPWLTGTLFAGFVVGYVCYDLTHYALHHVQFNRGVGKFLRTHHMRHHTEWASRFGVSTPLWDHVFGTEPAKHNPGEKRKS